MEEYSNGRLEKALKVEDGDEEKEVVLEDYSAAALKPDDVEFVKDIIADGNSVSVDGTPDDGGDSSSSSSSSGEEAEPEELRFRMENSENIEEEKLVSGVSDVEESGNFGVAKLDGKETEANISPSLDKTDAEMPILTDLLINGLEEEETHEKLSSSETTAEYSVLTDVESKGIEETTPTSLDESNNDSMLAEDVVSSGIDKNGGLTAASVAQGTMETKMADSDNDSGVSLCSPNLVAKEEDSSQAANVPPAAETRDAGNLANMTHETTGNQVNNPIISLSHHPVQPTSWKGCCGLFEVLTRSNR